MRILNSLLVGVAIVALPALAAEAPYFVESNVVSVGSLRQDEPKQQTVTFLNTGTEVLAIDTVQFSAPLSLTQANFEVVPGEQGFVTFEVGDERPSGDYNGVVAVNFKNSDVPRLLYRVRGEFVPDIQFIPMKAFYVATQRGEPKSAYLDVVSHLSEPLDIMRTEALTTRFTSRLEVVEEGRRFRLWLDLSGEGSAGELRERITLVTRDEENPFIEVPANTILRERVYVFPDQLDLGRIETSRLKAKPHLAGLYIQQFVVVSKGAAEGFKIQAHSDSPFLTVATSPSDMADRHQLTVSLRAKSLESGKIDTAIVIDTNDPEFPRLQIPVTGSVFGDW